MAAITVNLERVSRVVNTALPSSIIVFGALGSNVSFYFHFGTVTVTLLSLLNTYYRHGQSEHSLLRNFGLLAQARYIVESVGPELRQYLFADDTSERPFNRAERAEVYRKAKGVESTAAFGSQKEPHNESLVHSAYPVMHDELIPYRLTFGEERGCDAAYTIDKPIAISAMSYGALSAPAVRSLARGARLAGIPMNTGEGGYPKYHLMEGCDLIFQMGTAKFGVRNPEGYLDAEKLSKLAAVEQVKMVEIKLSQGAKPGKGGLLPAEKITDEIAELRSVERGRDVISPPRHLECKDGASTVAFIRQVQETCGLPVGIKLCMGRETEFAALVLEMKRQGVFPDYMAIDGAEGGTGAAPRSFLEDVGLPLTRALTSADRILSEAGVRGRLKLMAAGKLITPARQISAMARGAQAVYSARGFLLALGCIQALQCNKNTCPVGLTTHDPRLTRGVNIDDKAQRVRRYVQALMHEHEELLGSLGCRSHAELGPHHLSSHITERNELTDATIVPINRLTQVHGGIA
jgi:glutamate synthase domain-containing protein 2